MVVRVVMPMVAMQAMDMAMPPRPAPARAHHLPVIPTASTTHG